MSTKLGHCIRSESKKLVGHVDAAAVASIFDDGPMAAPLLPLTRGGARLITLMIIPYKISGQQCDNFDAITCIRNHLTSPGWCARCVVNDSCANDDDNGNDLFGFWFAIVAFGWSSRLRTYQIVIFVLTFHLKLSYRFCFCTKMQMRLEIPMQAAISSALV